MKSGFNSTRLAFWLAALLAGQEIFAAENGSNTRNSPPAPPATGAPVAEKPAATDAAAPKSANALTSAELPPLPPGVAEIKFSEFFRQPVGARGLEFADKLRGLDGRRVRVLGYMVRQSQPVARCLLLTPVPLELHEDEYGFAEDMPATVLHVFADARAPVRMPFTPGLLLLTGTLSLGNRTEADGRVSSVRLQLDAFTPEQRHVLNASTRNTTTKTEKPPKPSASGAK